MAIVVPIVSTWDPKGVDRSIADIKRAEGGWGKVGAGFRAGLMPAVGALGALGFAAKGWVAEAEGGRQASARLAQVFSQMGDATGKAAADAEAYASSLSKSIAVDDDVIKGTQAKLATFSALSSEVGRSSGMFDRATAAAHDLAAAGFGDASSNAVQLGKALQDPIKGVTALAKSGVTFTAAEKEKIKALTESGDLLGAQKIVMAAVETQVGGVAAATATSSAKMSTAWGELSESLGTMLLPLVDKAAVVFAGLADWVGRNSGAVMALVGVIAGLAAVIVAVNVAMKIYQTTMAVIRAVTMAWTAVQWALNTAMFANPIGLVVLAIVALVAIIVVAYKRSDTFRKIVTTAWNGIKTATSAVFTWVGTKISQVWGVISNLFRLTPIGLLIANFDRLKAAVGAVATFIIERFRAAWAVISNIVDKIAAVKDRVAGWVDKITPWQVDLGGGQAAAYGTTPYTIGGVTRSGGQVALTGQDVRQGRRVTRAVAW